jgi:hypothetical protein
MSEDPLLRPSSASRFFYFYFYCILGISFLIINFLLPLLLSLLRFLHYYLCLPPPVIDTNKT